MSGRHRDPGAAITGPLRIGRPSRQQLVDRTDRWDGPERRHLAQTDDRPATGWDQAAVPAPLPASVETTGSFSPEEVAAAIGHPMPRALHGPDPAGTGPIPWWHTGEMPIVPAPRDDDEPSLAGWWALAYALITAAVVLLGFVLAPGGA